MLAALQADPLNSHRTCAAGAPLKGCKSIVELPGAPPQPWIIKNTSVPAGTVAHYSLKSERLKNERSLSVYTPASDRPSGAPAALLIVFDGSAYLSSVPTPTILDNLIAAGRIAPTVAAFVDFTGIDVTVISGIGVMSVSTRVDRSMPDATMARLIVPAVT